jgi:hypothetical protein
MPTFPATMFIAWSPMRVRTGQPTRKFTFVTVANLVGDFGRQSGRLQRQRVSGLVGPGPSKESRNGNVFIVGLSKQCTLSMMIAVGDTFPSFKALQAAWFTLNHVLSKEYRTLENRPTRCFSANCFSAPVSNGKMLNRFVSVISTQDR